MYFIEIGEILHKTRSFLILLLCEVVFSSAAIAGNLNTDIGWYRSDDPLNTKLDLPPAISARDLAANGEEAACTKIDMTKPLSLAEVTEVALCNNPQTELVYANAKIQAAQVGIARSIYYPTISDNVGVNGNLAYPKGTRGRDYYNLSNNLVASYLLYDFGNRDAALENARQLLQAASATQSAVVQNVMLSAVKAYFQVQADTALLEANKDSENLSLESFKAAEAKYKVGALTPADKLQAQTAYAQATLTRITTEGALKNDYGTLANVMGLGANTELKLQDAHIPTGDISNIESNISQLIEQASQRRPDLLASDAKVKAAMASIDASRAAAKPTISVSLSNGFNDGTNISYANTSTLGLTVSVPIFAGYGPSYSIRSAEAAAESASALRDQLKLQISLDVWTAFQNLRTANEAIKSADVLVASAKESERFALGRYKAGVGNIIDTLTAQNALASAKQQQIKAILNLNIARAALAQAMGTLDNAFIQSMPDTLKEDFGKTP
jgi:outer membrane protein